MTGLATGYFKRSNININFAHKHNSYFFDTEVDYLKGLVSSSAY